MKKKYSKLTYVIIAVVFCLLAGSIYYTVSNGKAFDTEINDIEKIFHGSFTSEKGYEDCINPLSGYNICISLSEENIGYDEKNLTFSDAERGDWKNFNCYYIRTPGEKEFNEDGQLETTWYLCDYDGVNSVVLLDEKNEEIGRITYKPAPESWTGRRDLNYYWIHDGEATQIYKRSEQTYQAGKGYLKSRHYTGVFEGHAGMDD